MVKNYFARTELSETSPATGKLFIHITTWWRRWISICCEVRAYGRLQTMPQECSLMTQILRSISPICSDAAQMLMFAVRRWSRTVSNSLSMRMVWTRNPARPYTLMILWRRSPSFEAVRWGKCSIVIKLMFLELETRNGMPLTNITSATRVTLPCTSRITRGISTYSILTRSGLHQTVLPLRLVRSGEPNILLAWTMSALVIGQVF